MKKQFLLLIIPTIFAMSSCTVMSTLYPLSENENDFLFKKELIGEWGDAKDTSGFFRIDTVAGTGGKLYRTELISYEKGNAIDTGRFLARLINISGWYFLDCWLDMQDLSPSKEKDYSDFLITKHFFYRLNFMEPDKIEMAFPDADELIKLIDQKKIFLHYTRLKKDDYLILDNPKDLRKGLTASKKYPLLYKDKILLVRLK